MSARGQPESVFVQAEHAVLDAANYLLHEVEHILELPEPPSSRWHRSGMSRRAERALDAVGAIVLILLTTGWTWSITEARTADAATGEEGLTPATAAVASALTDPDANTTAFLTEAVLNAITPLRGESGRLQAHVQPQGAPIADSILTDSLLPEGARVIASSGAAPSDSATAPRKQGVWQMAVKVGTAIKPVTNFNLITLTPFSEKRRGRIGLYFIGSWPTEGRRRDARPKYAPPSGFIEVTRENQDTPLSDHFRLRDFLTHDQQHVWPKYLVVDTKLVDKLELVVHELEKQGIDVSHVRVMSGFRTPQYNVGGGNTAGRASLSRHMYGDAADIFIDANRNDVMDDLNGDRRVNIQDARVIEAAASRVEAGHPALVGGVGVYPACCGHGPFVHIDTRGYRARWLGEAGGS